MKKNRCRICNRTNHTTAEHVSGYKSSNNAKDNNSNKKRCDICNRINHTTAEHVSGHKSSNNAKDKGKDINSYQYLYTMISNSASTDNICLKQVRVTTANDVNFKDVIDVQDRRIAQFHQ